MLPCPPHGVDAETLIESSEVQEEDAVDKEIGRRHDVHPVAEPVHVDLADARDHDSPGVSGVDRSVLPIEDRHVANSHVGRVVDVDRRPLTRLDERSGIDRSVATDHDVVRTSDLDRAANECARRNIDGCIAPDMKHMSAWKNMYARAEEDEAPLSRRAVSRRVHEEVNVVEDVAADLERDIGGRTQTKRRGLAVLRDDRHHAQGRRAHPRGRDRSGPLRKRDLHRGRGIERNESGPRLRVQVDVHRHCPDRLPRPPCNTRPHAVVRARRLSGNAVGKDSGPLRTRRHPTLGSWHPADRKSQGECGKTDRQPIHWLNRTGVENV